MQFLRFLIVDRGETFGQLSHALDHVELGWIDLQITHAHALRASRIGRFGLEVTGKLSAESFRLNRGELISRIVKKSP